MDKRQKITNSINNKREWLVIVAYGYSAKQRGDIVSAHKTYQSAHNAARNNPCLQIVSLSDALFGLRN